MGLLVWMPLNGNLDNLGLTQVSVTPNGGSASYSDGKIGQGLSCNGSIFYNIGPITLGVEATIAWWEKTSTAAKVPFTLVTDASSYGLTVWGSNSTHIYTLNTGDGANDPFKNGTNNVTSIYDGKWHHFAVTFGNSVAKLYIDGAYAGTAQTFKSPAATAKTLRLAGGSNNAHSYDFDGMLNDFRVYDHCLSPKDVKEISLGLILHYPLCTRDVLMSKCSSVTWNQLVQNGDFSNGTSNWSIHDSSLESINVSNGELTLTKVGGSYGGMCRVNPFTADSTHVYYLKATLKSNDGTQAFFGFCTSSWTVGSNIQYNTTSLNYETISFTASPAANTARLILRIGAGSSSAGVSLTCKNFMCIDLTAMFGAGNEPTKEECDIIFCDNYYSYDAGTSKNLKESVYDRSGYGRDAVAMTNLTLTSSSPRYNMYASNTANYPLRATFDFPQTNGITVACWVNMSTWGYQGSGIFSTTGQIASTPTDYNTTTFNHYDGKIYLRGTDGTTYNINLGTTSTSDVPVNVWKHVVFTHDGSTVKLYINGSLVRSKSVPTPLVAFKRLYLGTSFAVGTNRNCLGKWSDFRMYATALSAEDVKELYSVSASVDNLGNLHCYEAEEMAENLFKVEYINEVAEQPLSWITRNGENALALRPTNFYESSVYAKIFRGKFAPNTQYKFDLWMDVDDVVSSGSNVMGGFKLYYTDGTSTPTNTAVNSLVRKGNSSTPYGFQHKVFYSEPNKTIDFLITYYYTNNYVYYRWDSVIVPMLNSISVEKTGIVDTVQFREDTAVARICKGDNFDVNNIIEI